MALLPPGLAAPRHHGGPVRVREGFRSRSIVGYGRLPHDTVPQALADVPRPCVPSVTHSFLGGLGYRLFRSGVARYNTGHYRR